MTEDQKKKDEEGAVAWLHTQYPQNEVDPGTSKRQREVREMSEYNRTVKISHHPGYLRTYHTHIQSTPDEAVAIWNMMQKGSLFTTMNGAAK